MWSSERSRTNRLRIAVLAGGTSAEREISLQSGATVAAALRAGGHQAVLLDPATIPLADIAWGQYDACFIALHGGAGEDGRIQRRLELLKVHYTGSGPDACRLAMSKSASKERLRQERLDTADYELFDGAAPTAEIKAKLERLGLPLVIKPDSQGSSLGVSIVPSWDELPAAIVAAGRYETFLLAERFIAGREFTVAMIDREALPLVEIVTPQAFFDYQAKYTAPNTVYRVDAGIGPAAETALRQAARGAAEALGTRGLVRVDLILDDHERAWILEVNTVPGMTSHSLVPRAAAAAGITLCVLCDRLVRDCLPLGSMR